MSSKRKNISNVFLNGVFFVVLLFSFSGCQSLNNQNQLLLAAQKIRNTQQPLTADDPRLNRLPESETLTYDVRYLKMSFATVTVDFDSDVMFKDIPAYRFEFHVKTKPLWSKVFDIDSRIISYMDRDQLHILRHEEYRREGRYKKDAVTEYDHDNQVAYYHHLLNNEFRQYSITKGIHDGLTAVYYLRMMPLFVGKTMRYWVNVNEKNYELFAQVQRMRKLKTRPLGKTSAFEIQPFAVLKGEVVRKGRLTGYVTDDHRRIPLRAEIKTPVFGSAVIVLTDVKQSWKQNQPHELTSPPDVKEVLPKSIKPDTKTKTLSLKAL